MSPYDINNTLHNFIQQAPTFSYIKLSWNIAEWITQAENIKDVAVIKLALAILLLPHWECSIMDQAVTISPYRKYKILMIVDYMKRSTKNLPIIMKELDVVADVMLLLQDFDKYNKLLTEKQLLHTVSADEFRSLRDSEILNILLFR